LALIVLGLQDDTYFTSELLAGDDVPSNILQGSAWEISMAEWKTLG
jgi:hypothetical protein